MDQEELNMLAHRLTQRPCRYQQSPLHSEQKGIIVGMDKHRGMCLIQDSYTGITYNVPAALVKPVALFGPEDMPAERYLKGYRQI